MNKIITDLIENKLFGVLEVDIQVKDEFKDFWGSILHFFVPVMFLLEL